MTKLLIVTPARNEVQNLPKLAASLQNQTDKFDYVWVVVDDNSTDGTRQLIVDIIVPFEKYKVETESTGKLISGGAYHSWWKGVDFGLSMHPDSDYVLKLDADVVLSDDYFEKIFESLQSAPDIVGGVISGTGREQSDTVPGPVKMYSRNALSLIRRLPIATGFDVMDEVICRMNGLSILVNKSATFELSRAIGHSQGKLHGRFRNGLVCRWTGYAPEYFALHLIRYLFRDPLLLGAFWMIFGYFRGGQGPYDPSLKKFFSTIQRAKLKEILINPIVKLRDLYSNN